MIFKVTIATIFIAILVYLFKTGKIAYAIGVGVAFIGVIASFFIPKRRKEVTKFKELTKIENEVKKAKKEAEDAIVETVPENKTDIERWKRWEDL